MAEPRLYWFSGDREVALIDLAGEAHSVAYGLLAWMLLRPSCAHWSSARIIELFGALSDPQAEAGAILDSQGRCHAAMFPWPSPVSRQAPWPRLWLDPRAGLPAAKALLRAEHRVRSAGRAEAPLAGLLPLMDGVLPQPVIRFTERASTLGQVVRILAARRALSLTSIFVAKAAQDLRRLELSDQGLSVWFNLRDDKWEAFGHHPSPHPWDWCSGTRLAVAHTYPSMEECLHHSGGMRAVDANVAAWTELPYFSEVHV